MSGTGIIWAICKSASRSRQITMPAPHHSVFYSYKAKRHANRTDMVIIHYFISLLVSIMDHNIQTMLQFVRTAQKSEWKQMMILYQSLSAGFTHGTTSDANVPFLTSSLTFHSLASFFKRHPETYCSDIHNTCLDTTTCINPSQSMHWSAVTESNAREMSKRTKKNCFSECGVL